MTAAPETRTARAAVEVRLEDLSRHYGGSVSGTELVLATDPHAVLDPDASLREAGVTLRLGEGRGREGDLHEPRGR